MKDLKNAAEVKAAANKKPYIKPDFEVYELNWEAPLLSASGESKPTEGGVGTNGLNIFNL